MVSPLSQLQAADELFYSNSLYTVRPIVRLENVTWQEHTVCESLFNCFRKELS